MLFKYFWNVDQQHAGRQKEQSLWETHDHLTLQIIIFSSYFYESKQVTFSFQAWSGLIPRNYIQVW